MLDTIKVVRITQILVDEGWKFIDNGSNNIESAVNENINEGIVFNSPADFEKWVQEKVLEYQI